MPEALTEKEQKILMGEFLMCCERRLRNHTLPSIKERLDQRLSCMAWGDTLNFTVKLNIVMALPVDKLIIITDVDEDGTVREVTRFQL